MFSQTALSPNKTDSQTFKRTEKLCFFLSPSELKVFEHKEKKLQRFYDENGYVYNAPDFFRNILLNCDNQELLNLLFKIYSLEDHKLFKKSHSNIKG